jgi:cysteine-rich repeat protein
VCGDGFKRGGEACDDGNLVANDGCSASCTVETGFTCNGSPSSCNDVCGDGVKSTREDCDDGNNAIGDGCNGSCELEFCGDGIVNGGAVATSITFRWLVTSCSGATPITFSINGSVALTTTADGGTCTCTPGINQAVVTSTAELALLVEGTNTFSVSVPGADAHTAWATATVTTAEGATTFTVFDFNGGDDGINNRAELCVAQFTENVSASVTQALDGGEGCDDGDNVAGDGCSASCSVEAGFDCTEGSPSRCSALPVRTSCLAHRLAGVTASGLYVIDPDGAGAIPSSTVFCDMVTDGGGYTFLKVLQTLQGDAAEAFCAARGMHLLIPRTQAHFQRTMQLALDASVGPSAGLDYGRIFGVFPDFVGASCGGQPLNSVTGTCPWRARDGQAFFIHNTTIFGEPSGDNCLNCSMDYNYDGAGNLVSFNDFPAQPTATAFICDVGDKF